MLPSYCEAGSRNFFLFPKFANSFFPLFSLSFSVESRVSLGPADTGKKLLARCFMDLFHRFAWQADFWGSGIRVLHALLAWLGEEKAYPPKIRSLRALGPLLAAPLGSPR